MCATMKYVSCCCVSTGTTACITPVMPPIVNNAITDTAKYMAVTKRILPPYIVPSQLKILTPVGTAIAIVLAENTICGTVPSPVVNMWWLHTAKPSTAIEIPAKTTAE